MDASLPEMRPSPVSPIPRIAFAAFLALFSGVEASAQLVAGARAGVSVSTATGAPELEREALLGFTAGAFARYRAGRLVSIQPELLVSQRGVDLVSDGRPGPVRVTYLEAPVLLVVTTPLLSVIAVDAYVGPVGGLLLAEKGIDTGSTASSDLGIVIGFDLSSAIRHRRERFGVGVRQMVGLTEGVRVDAAALRHAVFTLTAHVRF